MPKVTVYIVTYNYGKFLPEALRSVLRQTFTDWELIVIDDGSEDDTADTLKAYEGHASIRVFHQPHQGLIASCNWAIKEAKGEYIVRLDADDYFDENALLVLSQVLDTYSDVALVYPDYYRISENGEILEHVRRKKIQDDVRLLDLPAHGAGTMMRKKCLDEVGGYDEGIDRQDGYDIWIKIIDRFRVYNVNLPLFYYRRHPASLTNNVQRILTARRRIKRKYVQRKFQHAVPTTLAITPVRSHSDSGKRLALRELAGKPLLQHCLEQIRQSEVITRLVVTTEDTEIASLAARLGAEVVMRPEPLGRINVPIEPTILHVLRELERKSFVPEIVALVYMNSPLIKAEHITEAVDTQLIFRTDSVISVSENIRFQYRHGTDGLEPLFQSRELRLERDALFEENGVIYVSRTNVITEECFLGKVIGHIVMPRESSVHIDTDFEFWLAEKIFQDRQKLQALGMDL